MSRVFNEQLSAYFPSVLGCAAREVDASEGSETAKGTRQWSIESLIVWLIPPKMLTTTAH
jgi:hypothetical protein